MSLGRSLSKIKGQGTGKRKWLIVHILFIIYQLQYKKMAKNFPLNQFRLALSKTSKIKTSLQPFLLQFRKNNMQWILAAVQELSEYLENSKTQLIIAFNSLFALKFILDNADVVMTHAVEAYLLPTILQIASYQIQNKNEMRGDSYFISKGFKGDKETLQNSGYHFVRIAYELIMAVSQVKPKATCFGEEIQETSEFQNALQSLKKKGFESFKSFMFYEVSIIKETRNSFLKSLETYSQEISPFKQFFENFTKEYLAKGIESKTKISPFKLLEKGEATAVQIVVKECLKSLRSADLTERTRALSLMNELVLWGDITVAYQINCEGSINEAVREVTETKEKGVGLGLERAAKVLKGYQNSDKEKEEYYRVLLKCVKLWGKCYPTAINSIDRVSNIKFLCGQLQKQSIHFPDYENIFKDQALFEANRRKRLKINQKLFNYLQNLQGQRMVSYVNVYIDQANSIYYEKKSSFQKFSQEIESVADMLDKICQKEERIIQYMDLLNKFCKQFDVKIDRGQFNSADLQYIINEGVPLIERAERIMPYLQQYKDQVISFAILKATLSSKNKKLTMSQLYNSYRLSKVLDSTNLQEANQQQPEINGRNSYQLQLLPLPKIDITQSHELTVEDILKAKFKSKISQAPKKKSTMSHEQALMSFSIDNLLQSKQISRNCSPNCLKLLHKLESMAQYQEFQGITFKFQQLRKGASKVL